MANPAESKSASGGGNHATDLHNRPNRSNVWQLNHDKAIVIKRRRAKHTHGKGRCDGGRRNSIHEALSDNDDAAPLLTFPDPPFLSRQPFFTCFKVLNILCLFTDCLDRIRRCQCNLFYQSTDLKFTTD